MNRGGFGRKGASNLEDSNIEQNTCLLESMILSIIIRGAVNPTPIKEREILSYDCVNSVLMKLIVNMAFQFMIIGVDERPSVLQRRKRSPEKAVA